MKSTRLLYLLLIVGFAPFLQSCGDDEEPDPVAQAEGTYNYNVKFYLLDGTTLQYLGTDFDDSGTAILSKTATGFEVKEGGTVQFTGTKVAKASNGFTFDIASQTVTEGGSSITVTGYEGADLGGTKYDGLYISATKKITAYMKFEGFIIDEDGNEFEVELVLEFAGTKV